MWGDIQMMGKEISTEIRNDIIRTIIKIMCQYKQIKVKILSDVEFVEFSEDNKMSESKFLFVYIPPKYIIDIRKEGIARYCKKINCLLYYKDINLVCEFNKDKKGFEISLIKLMEPKEKYECNICFIDYGKINESKNKLAVNLLACPNCSFTFCSECEKKLLLTKNRSCPQCRRDFL